jgi:hypothetical protein
LICYSSGKLSSTENTFWKYVKMNKRGWDGVGETINEHMGEK